LLPNILLRLFHHKHKSQWKTNAALIWKQFFMQQNKFSIKKKLLLAD
jgi:hypothetical protein